MNEREFVKGLYPKSRTWAKRVSKMSDAQVFAIYKKALNKNNSKKEGDK